MITDIPVAFSTHWCVQGAREDEVDAAIKEVSDMLGGLETSGMMRGTEQASGTLRFTRPLLSVDRR